MASNPTFSKPRVTRILQGTALSPNAIAMLRYLSSTYGQELGFNFVTDSKLSPTCTHLIIEKVKLTEKFLSALARGIPIATLKDLIEHTQNKKWPSDEILDFPHGEKWERNNLHISPLSLRRVPRFAGIVAVVVMSDLQEKHKYESILTAGGGRLVQWTIRHLGDIPNWSDVKREHKLTHIFGDSTEASTDPMWKSIVKKNKSSPEPVAIVSTYWIIKSLISVEKVATKKFDLLSVSMISCHDEERSSRLDQVVVTSPIVGLRHDHLDVWIGEGRHRVEKGDSQPRPEIPPPSSTANSGASEATTDTRFLRPWPKKPAASSTVTSGAYEAVQRAGAGPLPKKPAPSYTVTSGAYEAGRRAAASATVTSGAYEAEQRAATAVTKKSGTITSAALRAALQSASVFGQAPMFGKAPTGSMAAADDLMDVGEDDHQPEGACGGDHQPAGVCGGDTEMSEKQKKKKKDLQWAKDIIKRCPSVIKDERFDERFEEAKSILDSFFTKGGILYKPKEGDSDESVGASDDDEWTDVSDLTTDDDNENDDDEGAFETVTID